MKRRRWVRRLGRRSWALSVACVALAAGGIVLLRAPGRALPPEQAPTVVGSTPAAAPVRPGQTRIRLEGPALSGQVGLDQGAVLAHGVRRVLAEINLAASEQGDVQRERSPVALAVVLDTSGSMSGEKIAEARNAVLQLVERMHVEDQVALVAYDHTVQVVQPLAPVGAVRDSLRQRIRSIEAGGGTLIPEALSAGAVAVEAAPESFVRRIVLVSDGLDGSGQPVEMVSSEVTSRARKGISLSSLGIGVDYDERFLTAVADAGRGNYEFLASGAQLASFLQRELEEASNTVVDGVVATLELPAGWTVRRAHGAEAQGTAGSVRVPIGPMFAGDDRRVVLELSVAAGAPGALGAMRAGVDYRTVADSEQHQLVGGGALALRAVADEALARASVDPEVSAYAQSVLLDAEQERAVEAWRRGDRQTAQRITRTNLASLRRLQRAAPPAAAEALEAQAGAYELDDSNFGAVSASSADGRAYGLDSNARRRARARRR